MIFLRCTDPKYVVMKDVSICFGDDLGEAVDYVAGEPIPVSRMDDVVVIGEGHESIVLESQDDIRTLLCAIFEVESIQHDEDSYYQIVLKEAATPVTLESLPVTDLTTRRKIHTPTGVIVCEPTNEEEIGDETDA